MGNIGWLLSEGLIDGLINYTGDVEGALISYTHALSINFADVTTNTNLAHLHRLHGNWETALHYYTTASKHHHGNPMLHYYAALMLIELEQYKVINLMHHCECHLCLRDSIKRVLCLLGDLLIPPMRLY